MHAFVHVVIHSDEETHCVYVLKANETTMARCIVRTAQAGRKARRRPLVRACLCSVAAQETGWISKVDQRHLFDRKKRIAAAVLVTYVGTKYKGVQVNHESARGQTIEDNVLGAIFRAGGISQGELDKPASLALHWSRLSRTDKGAHANINVLGGRFVFQTEVSSLSLCKWFAIHIDVFFRCFIFWSVDSISYPLA